MKKGIGILGRIKSFFIGVLCGILILTGVSAYIHGRNFWDTLKSFVQKKESIENHDMT